MSAVMPKGELNAVMIFKKNTEDKGLWEGIKAKCLHLDLRDEKEEGQREKIEKDTESLMGLVAYRDIIDFRMYRLAIDNIFPPTHYNLTATVKGEPEEKEGHYRFRASWYEFAITSRTSIIHGGDKIPSITIRINAPGSRTATSDIDTSIATTFSGDIKALLENAHSRVKDRGPDYSGRITNAVIDQFYLFSEREFGITSGLHRDSNAYIDLAAKEIEPYEYPKFKDDGTRNPQIGKEKPFKPDEFVKEFAPYKKGKHILEMAASLFSLRMALDSKEAKEWEALKKQIISTVTSLNDRMNIDEDLARQYIASSVKDLEEVFKQTEVFFDVFQKSLAEKKREVTKSKYGTESKLSKENQDKDFEIAALNRLYVEYLEKMTALNGKILQLKEKNTKLIEEFKSYGEPLETAEKQLAVYLGNSEIFKQEIITAKNLCASLRSEQESRIKQFKETSLQIADLELQKLAIRYQAHTFANEAYVCRSAVYHVVMGMQQGGSITLSEQTILGSLLQQIGFKLLHSHDLEKLAKPPKEVWYRTSKYGFRVGHLLFSRQTPEIKDSEIKSAVEKFGPNNLGIFSKLKSLRYKEHLFRIFTVDELTLLNTEAEIAKIKGMRGLSEAMKHEKTQTYLEKPVIKDAKTLYLSIVAKAIAAVYFSRFERKHRLWGVASYQSPETVPATGDKKSTVVTPSQAPRGEHKTLADAGPQKDGAALFVPDATFKGVFNATVKEETGTGAAVVDGSRSIFEQATTINVSRTASTRPS